MNIVRYGVIAVAVLALGGQSQHVGAQQHQGTGLDPVAASEDAHRQAIELEHEYRQRLQRLDRLRRLAEQQDDRNRAAELEALHDRLRLTHAERIEAIRSRMSEHAARRLDEALDAGGDHEAWLRHHRERADQLRDEHRQGHDGRTDRDDRHDRRWLGPGPDATSERRAEHRQMRRENRADQRDTRRARRDDRRETRHETRRERRRHRGRETRDHARDRAEQHWIEAREDVGRRRSARHMNHAASRLAEKRWREEARNRSAERWEHAAQRSGMFDDVRSPMSPEDADREFERLRREIEGR